VHLAFAALQSDLEYSLFSGQSIAASMIAQRTPPTLSLTLTLLISDRSPCLEDLSPLQGSCTDRVVGGFKWASGEQSTRLSRASG
jgi:hypothetical protein